MGKNKHKNNASAPRPQRQQIDVNEEKALADAASAKTRVDALIETPTQVHVALFAIGITTSSIPAFICLTYSGDITHSSHIVPLAAVIFATGYGLGFSYDCIAKIIRRDVSTSVYRREVSTEKVVGGSTVNDLKAALYESCAYSVAAANLQFLCTYALTFFFVPRSIYPAYLSYSISSGIGALLVVLLQSVWVNAHASASKWFRS